MHEVSMRRYSVIIPSRGVRPKALGMAIDSVLASAEASNLKDAVEILVGFDGVRGERVRTHAAVRWFDLPTNNDFGNALRHALLKASTGQRLIFLDDDNVLTPEAFHIYEANADVEMLIARIDVSRAHPIPYLPVEEDGKPLIRPCNIDPLCLCLARELVITRCGGWQGEKYEADYHNILRYSRRAASTRLVPDLVGVYDAGRGLDEGGLNFRQKVLS